MIELVDTFGELRETDARTILRMVRVQAVHAVSVLMKRFSLRAHDRSPPVLIQTNLDMRGERPGCEDDCASNLAYLCAS